LELGEFRRVFILLPRAEVNIAIDFTSIIQAFQDLRYIGELGQRWNEIKKLQVIPIGVDVLKY
jgi:hypothetical protein